jgi:acetyltransferase-like isoleucine patch superfamily enzyme
MTRARTLPWDWHPGAIPANVAVDDAAYLETTYSFDLFRSERSDAVQIGHGASTYLGVMFDVGPRGRVVVGDYALVHGARIICDAEITVGEYALISWNVVLMDTYRLPFDAAARRAVLRRVPHLTPRVLASDVHAQPIHVGPNVWIGFDACVLPGVTIGAGSVVGARSVVTTDVAPYTLVAGNPARVIRRLEEGGKS